ncbi:MAG: helix-turn-helix domain-containing protein [Synechococcus sp.]|nr:helix-turn-helix domain-containing protein [Synechococcus sp.]
MAAGRLSDSQKQELVAQYRAGVASSALATAFGCSVNTVSRTVKALLSPEDYDSLKKQRGRGGAAQVLLPLTPADDPVPASAAAAADAEAAAPIAEIEAVVPASSAPEPDDAEDPIEEASTLALDDADDFSAEDPEDDELDGLGDEDGDSDAFVAIAPLSVAGDLDSSSPCVSKPLVVSELPGSLYLLVDREVELKGTLVKEFSELGAVAAEEENHKAIALFANPRQAKRQCGRSQRVIKVPDPGVLERTAPFILAQGISRLVLEGTLYALPGS